MKRKRWAIAIFIAIVIGAVNAYAMSGDFVDEATGHVMTFSGSRRDGHADRQIGTVSITATDDHGRVHTTTGTFWSTNLGNGRGSLRLSFTSGFLNGREFSYSVERWGRWAIVGHGERWVQRR